MRSTGSPAKQSINGSKRYTNNQLTLVIRYWLLGIRYRLNERTLVVIGYWLLVISYRLNEHTPMVIGIGY
jgi:hypothetical protein